MGIAGLDWQRIEIPFAAGLNQKADARAKAPPALDIAKDVQFSEVGGLQTRKPYAQDVAGLANCRRILEHNGELIVFTKDTLYTWSAAESAWIARGTHLAVEVDERERFSSPSDAIHCDRATLSGVTVYAWTDNGTVWIAGVDVATGGVTFAPKPLDDTSTSPRLVAGVSAILLFYVSVSASRLKYRTLNPLALSTDHTATSATTITSASGTLAYDVALIPASDTAIVVQSLGSSYDVASCHIGGTIIASTAKARASDGPIGVAITPDGAHAQVIRIATNVVGDYVNATNLVDVTVNQAIGTIANGQSSHVTCCYRSVADSGHFRCYAFWTDGPENTGASANQVNVNWVDDAGTIGTASQIVRKLGLASRAFDVGGRIFVWAVFGGLSFATSILAGAGTALQSTMFLYRDDAFLAAKALATRAGGLLPLHDAPSQTATVLPQVELVGGRYAMAATERRKVPVGTGSQGYTARAPRELLITFDSNRARRAARLGSTLYIAGGEILQYDGIGLFELGWHVYPWFFTLAQGTGSVPNGAYAWKVTARWDNGNGERDRSTTGAIGTLTISAGPGDIEFAGTVPIYTTHKLSPSPTIEVWRTPVSPSLDTPLFLATSNDPAHTSNPNRYVANDVNADFLPQFNDNLSDASLSKLDENPENGAILATEAPPSAKIVIASGTRLFLGAVAGDPDRIWYSQERADGRVAEFSEELRIDVPVQGGVITALGIIDDTLIVFRETAIYALPGVGFDATGDGQNFGPAHLITADVGATVHESVVATNDGLIFKSGKGWYQLSQRFSVDYIGALVAGYDAEEILSAEIVQDAHEIRIVTSARMLKYDYFVNQWGENTIADAIDSTVWNGSYTYLTSGGPFVEQDDYDDVDYGLDVETAWIKPGEQLDGAARVRWAIILGEYRGAHALRIRTAYDYKVDGSGNPLYVDDYLWTPSPTIVGGPLELRRGFTQQQCKALKIRITAVAAPVPATLDLGATLTLATSQTVLQATLVGSAGNALTFQTIGDGGGSSSWSVGGGGTTYAAHFGTSSPASGLESLIGIEHTLGGMPIIVGVADGTPTRTFAVENAGGPTHFSGGTDAGVGPPTTEALKLTSLSLEIGAKRGLNRRLPAAQKA